MKIFLLCFFLGLSIVCQADAKVQKCDVIAEMKCISCDSRESFEVGSKEACQSLCPDRIIISSHPKALYCALRKCPGDSPYRDDFSGTCKSSLDEEDKTTTLFDKKMEEIRNDEMRLTVTAVNGRCPDDFPIFYMNRCYPCNYKYELSVSKDKLTLCPERIAVAYPWNPDSENIETYLKCPDNKPLRSWTGECFSCDYPETVNVLSQCLEDDTICDTCPNRTILPQVGGNRRSILNCPADRPLMDNKGICFPCDTNIDIQVYGMEDSCVKYCPQTRELQNDLCIKKH